MAASPARGRLTGIAGTTATATVESDAAGNDKTTTQLTLTKARDGWRISSLGRPSGA